MVKELMSVADVAAKQVAQEGRFYSATHEEIAEGMTSDIYFIKTREILQKVGKEHVVVAAEIFARRPGIFAGIGEVLQLLKDKGLEVWALPEGSPFEAKEVLVRIIGEYSRFGIMETALLGFLASSSGWATAAKAAKDAAEGAAVSCFGARHVHPAVAPVMERAALVGGCDSVSCILGAKLCGREPAGTTPHALFLIMGDTVEGALAYHQIMPEGHARIVLVDTFKDEAEESLRVADAMGKALEGIRLDTPSERGGVTAGLVRELRARLDMAGYDYVKIFVSGGLNPDRIRELKAAGADAFGVGSYISGASAIDMTMDIKEVEGKAVTKRGRIPGRTENPRLQRVL